MRLDFTIVSLPGNGINLTDFITVEPSFLYFTARNWSTEVVLFVDGTSESPVLLSHSHLHKTGLPRQGALLL